MNLSEIDPREYDIKALELRAQREMREWAERNGNWAVSAAEADERARQIAQCYIYGEATTLALYALFNPELLWEDREGGEEDAGTILGGVIARRAHDAAVAQFEATKHEFELDNEINSEGFADPDTEGFKCWIDHCPEGAKLLCFTCCSRVCGKHAVVHGIYAYCPECGAKVAK